MEEFEGILGCLPTIPASWGWRGGLFGVEKQKKLLTRRGEVEGLEVDVWWLARFELARWEERQKRS